MIVAPFDEILSEILIYFWQQYFQQLRQNIQSYEKKVLSHVVPYFHVEKTRAWSLHIDHLSTFELPSSLQFSAVAGKFSTSSWFTEAHIEACADDSIAAVLMGTKVFIYSSEIAVSQWLLRRLRTVRNFMEIAMSGPPLGWSDKLFVCIPDHKSLVVQPTMWAPSVVTLDSPAFVAGWEAACPQDKDCLTKVQSMFAKGLGIEEQRQIRSLSPSEQIEILPFVPGDVGELMRREAASGQLTKTSSTRGRKKKFWSHLPNVKKAEARKQLEKEGEVFNVSF